MAENNLYEIIAYILKEIDRNGNPDGVTKKYNLDNEKYKEILLLMVDEEYIKSGKTDYGGSPIPESALITNKGRNLIKKHF